jgi:hypothetical protein
VSKGKRLFFGTKAVVGGLLLVATCGNALLSALGGM